MQTVSKNTLQNSARLSTEDFQQGIWLIGNRICPFSQRARIMLVDSGMMYQNVEVDFILKPSWLAEVSPLNKVPLLFDNGFCIFDSAAIIEYVDEKLESRYFGTDVARRALIRSWCLYANAIHADVRGYFTASNTVQFNDYYNRVMHHLNVITRHLNEDDFVSQGCINVLGVTYGPLFVLLSTLSDHGPHQFVSSDPSLQAIESKLLDYPAIKFVNTVEYRHALIDFLTTANSEFAVQVQNKLPHLAIK